MKAKVGEFVEWIEFDGIKNMAEVERINPTPSGEEYFLKFKDIENAFIGEHRVIRVFTVKPATDEKQVKVDESPKEETTDVGKIKHIVCMLNNPVFPDEIKMMFSKKHTTHLMDMINTMPEKMKSTQELIKEAEDLLKQHEENVKNREKEPSVAQIPTKSWYHRTYKLTKADIYRGFISIDYYWIINLIGNVSSWAEHAVKKALFGGRRGHKDRVKDLEEAIKSLEGEIEFLKEHGDVNETR